jgi:hypothetical protein
MLKVNVPSRNQRVVSFRDLVVVAVPQDLEAKA